jgi:branched-chain amino acid transport system permease protein
MNAATTRNLTIAFFVLLAAAAVSPMVAGQARFPQWLEVVLGGLMSGVLYSLVAIGLVLIFKASGVFNFAQGAMVLFAALSLVRLMEKMPFLVALAVTMAIMVALAFLIEYLVLRRLVNQDPIVLFMATLGIAYFLDGFGQTIWGSDIYTLQVGMPKEPKIFLEGTFEGGILVSMEDVVAAVLAALMVGALAFFFQKTSTGRALRAVADDHQAAQSIGIPLNRIWLIIWSIAGLVALVAGIIWGSKLGVQFSLSQVALKALPVVILGGFTSIPGAIVGGLIIGLGEKISEVYLGPLLGGGIENWFAYVLALVFLLFRPEGLFGERHIDRV